MKTTLDLSVLRALARLSRRGKSGELEALAVRSGGTVEEVRGAIGRLSRADLVDRTRGLRLTMAGLAVAVASAAPVAAGARRPARALAVRRRAA
jgi:RIO-like serine/threonine protein kinase